jgi:uncharacterized protein YdbL (DUF1318 family)
MNKKSALLKITPLLLGLWLAAMPVAAADLAQAKAAGMVGEQMNGLLGVVPTDAPEEIRSLVQTINTLRQAEYQRIAAKNGVPADEVAKLTAQKVINQAPDGHFVQTPSGWEKR